MSRAVEELQAQVEVLKLARLLDREPDGLAYLRALSPDDLRSLREGVTGALFDGRDGSLGRVAAASRLLPTGLTANISQRAFGPLLSARLAGLLDTDRAVDVAGKLPPSFLADIAIEMDPRRATELISRISPQLIAQVTQELGRRGEYVAMGRFVGHLNDEAVDAALETMDDRALLQVAFVLEDKAQLPRLVDHLHAARVSGIIAAAARDGEWVRALDLLNHLAPSQRAPFVAATLALGEPVLQEVLAAVVAHDLWPEILLVAEHDEDFQRRLAERLRALPAERRQAAAEHVRRHASARRLGILNEVLARD